MIKIKTYWHKPHSLFYGIIIRSERVKLTISELEDMSIETSQTEIER